MKLKNNRIDFLIQLGMQVAQTDYEVNCKKDGVHNPNYKRSWREVTSEKHKDKRFFALTGTPDKAFVVADLKTNEVKCYNQVKECIKTI